MEKEAFSGGWVSWPFGKRLAFDNRVVSENVMSDAYETRMNLGMSA